MKIFIMVIGFLVLSLPSQGSGVRPYLQTLVKEHGLVKLAASPMWRRYFPASKDVPPSMDDYIKDNLDGVELQELADEDSEKAAEKVNELLNQWLEEIYPEPTEERVLEVLGEDATLRAHMVAFLMAYSMVEQQGLRIPLEQIFLHSYGVAMLVRAIDRENLEGKELQDIVNNFVNNNVLEFVYVGDGNNKVKRRKDKFYNGREDYLLRANHVKHPKLSGDRVNALWQLNYKRKLIKKLTPQLVDELIKQEVLPKDDLWKNYGDEYTVDLLSEPGTIGDFLPPVYRAEASDLDKYVMQEMGQKLQDDADESAIAEYTAVEEAVQDILTSKDNPGSLVQILQLSRMGFTLPQIEQLTYPTREAIIVSGAYSRDGFDRQHGTDIALLNETVEKTGELVFFLLSQGYAKSIADIKPHHVPSHDEMFQANEENKHWSMLLSADGKVVIVRQEQPQPSQE